VSVPEVGSLVLAAVFGAGGLQQLAGATPMRAMAERLEIDYRVFRFVGVCQVLGTLGLVAGVALEPWTGIAAATGLAALAVLGLGAHARAREPWAAYLPALVLGGCAVALAFTL